MGKERQKRKELRQLLSPLARFWHHDGRRYCAIALCASLIAGNIGHMAVAASEDPDYKFELDRQELSDALQEAIANANVVQEGDLSFEGLDADTYQISLAADGSLYEVTPEIEENDDELSLRIFVRLPETELINDLDEAVETEVEDTTVSDGSENIYFLLVNKTDTEKTVTIRVGDKETEWITVEPYSAVEMPEPEGTSKILTVGEGMVQTELEATGPGAVATETEAVVNTSGSTTVSGGSSGGGNGGGGGSSGGGNPTIDSTTESAEAETEIIIPETEVTEPETEIVIPETEVTEPETDVDVSETEVAEPETEVDIPENEVTEPENEVDVPETGEPTIDDDVDVEIEVDDVQTDDVEESEVSVMDDDKSSDTADANAGSDEISSDDSSQNADSSDGDDAAGDDAAADADSGAEEVSVDDAITSASISFHKTYRVATSKASPSNATPSDATPSNASSSDAALETFDGIVLETVRMGNASVVAYVTTLDDVGITADGHFIECEADCSGEDCECGCHETQKVLITDIEALHTEVLGYDETTEWDTMMAAYDTLYGTLPDAIDGAYDNGELTDEEYAYTYEVFETRGFEILDKFAELGFDPYAVSTLEETVEVSVAEGSTTSYTINVTGQPSSIRVEGNTDLTVSATRGGSRNNYYIDVTINAGNAEAGTEEFVTIRYKLNNQNSSIILKIMVTDASEVQRQEVLGKFTNSSYPVYLAVRRNGELPGEPSVQGSSGYSFYNSRYTTRGTSTFASNANGIISTTIVDHEKFFYTSVDGTETVGLVDATGTAIKTAVTGVNWDSLLLAVAGAENVTATDGVVVTDNNVDNYIIVPYVIKLQETDGKGWHIDCAIVPKEDVTLSYDINIPAGMVITKEYSDKVGVPNNETGKPPATFSIGEVNGLDNFTDSDGQAYGNAIKVMSSTDSSEEYVFMFQGWNTKSDGSGTWYNPEAQITISEDTVLYAIWDSNPAIGTGNLKIKKLVVVSDRETINTDQQFSFTVYIKKVVAGSSSSNLTYEDSTESYNYTIYGADDIAINGGIGKISNQGTITLKHGQYAVIRDLPAVNVAGASGNITVTETVPTGYTVSWTGGTVSGNSTSIKIEGGRRSEVVCTNTMAPQTTTVKVTKTVSGNMADRSKQFNFTVVSDQAIAEGENYTLSVDRKTVEFSLSHNESVILKSVPKGATLTIRESGADDYKMTVLVGNDEYKDGTYTIPLDSSEITEITVKNLKEGDVDTGVLLDSMPYILILAAVIAGVAFYFIRKKKEDEDDLD